MLYLDSAHLDQIGIPWADIITSVADAVQCLRSGDVAQPLKPYLRFRNPTNRIIAMPAFVGGAVNMAGIKWIASFPGNLEKGMARANSVVILNDPDTGVPVCTINAGTLSAIRTAAVSGLMVREFERVRPLDRFTVGITGWGPIGRHHGRMLSELYGDRITELLVYDRRPVVQAQDIGGCTIRAVESWQQAYAPADVFVSCTVSDHRYIDLPPKPRSLQLNVSLRDYTPEIMEYVRSGIVVDDWVEVCRENTDIEAMHLKYGLCAADTLSIADVLLDQALAAVPLETPIMFNPMGMAIFDIAIATFYYRKALALGIGQALGGPSAACGG